MENGLNEKLNRIENTVKLMKTNLRLANDEAIEKVAEATNLKTLTNVFVQPNEPEIKDGIWIQADNELPFDSIVIDDNIMIPGKWRFDETTILNSGLGASFYNSPGRPHHFVCINDCLYIANQTSGKYLVKYNLLTGDVTKITLLDYAYYDMATNGIDKIYLVANQQIETVDLNTNTSTKQKYYDSTSYSGSAWRSCCYSEYDNCLYLVSPFGTGSYFWLGKIDLNTGNYTRIAMYGSGGNKSYHAIAHGNEIILVPGEAGFSGKVYKIDEDTLVNMTEYDVKNCICTANYSACDLGAYHYIFNLSSMSEGGCLQQVYKIHKDTLEYEDVTAAFQDDELAPLIGFFVYNEHFYAYRGSVPNTSSTGYQQGLIVPMDMLSSSFDVNAVVIAQSSITRSEKCTALWTYPFINGKLKQSFFDVYYYNKDTGFNLTLPTYYGDGEKWVKFKN